MGLLLTVEQLCQRMADALPTHPKDDDSSDLASSYEVVALLVHSYMTALDFKLQGFNEDKNIPECADLHPRLPAEWNSGFGSLSFVYRHKQSSMSFVIRVDRMGAKVEVRGLAVGDENIYRVERNTRDVVNASGLPVRITMTADGEDRSDLAEKLKKTLASSDAVNDLLTDVQTKIIQRLIPYLQKEGYTEIKTAESSQDQERFQQREEAARARAQQQPFPPFVLPGQHPRPGPRPPVGDFPPPGFEDEYEINRPPRGQGWGPGMPYNIGHDDLNPPGLGPHDPLRGSFVGGGLPRPGGGAGMHPTFDDPLFTGQGGFGGFPGEQQGYDPQAPPGARWDPTGPGGNPRFPGPGTGRGNNPFGGGGGFGGGFGGDII
ncbi:Fc.00g092180.m01.CDS01 [Cosmosporella sp. VM-42]